MNLSTPPSISNKTNNNNNTSSISNRFKRTTKSSIPTDDVPIGRTLVTVKGNPSHDPSVDDHDHIHPPYPACDKLSASFPLEPRYMYRVQYHGSRTRLNEKGLEADVHAWHPRCSETQPDLRQFEPFRDAVHKCLADVRDDESFYSPFVALYADENSADFWARRWRSVYKKEWERCWLFKIDTTKMDPDTTRFYSVWDLRNTLDVQQGDVLSTLIWQHKGEALVLHRVPSDAIVGIREILRPVIPWYKRRISWGKTKNLIRKALLIDYLW
ncbi:hypothetical protein DTO166G4_8741 [Paecilomyces variotii]|nr:hypothetical protein DTO166G4_8741 [Paecilomyces variotii]KAJ9228323.1 hypothetical protein DTO166G5_8655 [Paecilomyces variotii]KAJ9264472.1 hypothetical protein DTO195F2_2289 [Paecilomyces variotii]KAJ9358886.1 hypothetical protein DTO027B9_2181 [Paecilomyces variotii]KAJ9370397.1 hypothetical protein DTO282E5_4938 [Paecilomyces variotii]